ncbi:MAG: DUF749 family protein [Halobacteriota archaeon]|nr:DUF749 family protein [Halobacteriota archaeon]
MTHIAKIAAVTKVADVSKELISFVEFKAEREGRKLTGDESVIILHVDGTQSYHPIFLPAKIEDIEEELKKVDVTLNADSKKSILELL